MRVNRYKKILPILERKEVILNHGSKQLDSGEDFKRKEMSPTIKSPLAALNLS